MKRLVLLRRRRGLSRAALAEKAGISAAYLTNLEQGRRANPSVAVLMRLAAALDVAPSVLLDERREG